MKYLAAIVFILISLNGYGETDQNKLVKPILKAINKGDTGKLFSIAYPKGSSQRKYFSDSDVDEYDAKFKSLLESMGPSNGYFEYSRSDIPDTFEIIYYLFKFERQPALVVIQLYKPKDQWVIHSFSIDTEIDNYMEESDKNKLGYLGHEEFRSEIKANKTMQPTTSASAD